MLFLYLDKPSFPFSFQLVLQPFFLRLLFLTLRAPPPSSGCHCLSGLHLHAAAVSRRPSPESTSHRPPPPLFETFPPPRWDSLHRRRPVCSDRPSHPSSSCPFRTRDVFLLFLLPGPLSIVFFLPLFFDSHGDFHRSRTDLCRSSRWTRPFPFPTFAPVPRFFFSIPFRGTN